MRVFWVSWLHLPPGQPSPEAGDSSCHSGHTRPEPWDKGAQKIGKIYSGPSARQLCAQQLVLASFPGTGQGHRGSLSTGVPGPSQRGTCQACGWRCLVSSLCHVLVLCFCCQPQQVTPRSPRGAVAEREGQRSNTSLLLGQRHSQVSQEKPCLHIAHWKQRQPRGLLPTKAQESKLLRGPHCHSGNSPVIEGFRLLPQCASHTHPCWEMK